MTAHRDTPAALPAPEAPTHGPSEAGAPVPATTVLAPEGPAANLARARAASAALRAAGIAPARLDPIERARRNPKSKTLGIALKCWDCQGRDMDPGVVGRIRACSVSSCGLHPFRPYQDREAST